MSQPHGVTATYKTTECHNAEHHSPRLDTRFEVTVDASYVKVTVCGPAVMSFHLLYNYSVSNWLVTYGVIRGVK
jgi:hypothetical protein